MRDSVKMNKFIKQWFMNKLLLLLLTLASFHYSALSQKVVKDDQNCIFQSSLIKPEMIKELGPNRYFFDFGKDAFGTLVLNFIPSGPDTIIIHFGEKSINGLAVDRNPGGTIRYQKVKLAVTQKITAYTVKLPADKRNTNPPAVALPDSFGVITPFRYCEIENLKIPLNEIDIRQKTFNYAFNDGSSSFTSSDTILNKIWDLCKYSIKATSFCGVYIDGDRERIPYEADAYINQLSHYAVDNEYAMARRTNEYFIKNPTWPTEWVLTTVLMFYNDYMYTGDIAPLKRNYDALKAKTLIELEREDGLISTKSPKLTDELMTRLGFKDNKQRIRDIVDWPPAQKDTGWKLATAEGERDGYEMVPVNTVVNSFHFMNLKLMAEIAGWLDRKKDSDFFLKKSLQVKESINSKLFDKKKGIYIDGENSGHSSLHANMFPLAFGLVPEEYQESVVSFIKSRGMACSVYGAQFLLEGLYSANEADYAFDLLTSTSDRSWWNMIISGSTITLEAWDFKYKPNLDWNHAWGAAPANIISRNMWGITPSKPGFKHVRIKPQLSKLSSGEIKVPTINGTIKAKYKVISGTTEEYSIDLPEGISGEFVILHNKDFTVYLNNKIIKPRSEVIRLNRGNNTLKILK
jgi:alpha-L-rhamnosidase